MCNLACLRNKARGDPDFAQNRLIDGHRRFPLSIKVITFLLVILELSISLLTLGSKFPELATILQALAEIRLASVRSPACRGYGARPVSTENVAPAIVYNR